VTTIHRPARLATRAASFRYGGRHHSGIPGGIIPLHPGGFVGIGSELHEAHDLVVIDTAGAASQSTIFAIGCADLVLVPIAQSSADVIEGIKTVNLVKSASRMMGKEILRRVVLTAVQPGTNVADHIEQEVASAGLPVLKTRLHRLVAFQEMSFTGLAPASGLAGVQCSRFLDDLEALGALPEATKLAS